MNPTEPEHDSRDALTDALLREHARLGNLDDEGLLAAIRGRTVARTALPVEFSAPRLRPRTTTREWLQIAAIVALSLALIGVLFTNQVGSNAARTEQTHQLVTLPPAPVTVKVDTESESDVPRPVVSGLPGAVASNHVRFPELSPFVVSAKSTLQLSPGLLVYEGDVVMHHPEFTLKADRLELTAADPSGDAPVGTFVARGEGVEIEKRSASGGVEIARASQATYDAEGGRLILAGAPTLSAGNSFVQPHSATGVIILSADGYQVIER